MMTHGEFKSAGTYLVRLPHGDDLIEAIETACRDRGVQMAGIMAIGAVQRATIAFYDQSTEEYGQRTFEEPLEIASLIGNMSLRDGEPMLHAHAVFARENGQTVAGHLASPTEIFAAELRIDVFDGTPLERVLDDVTGLTLWGGTRENGN